MNKIKDGIQENKVKYLKSKEGQRATALNKKISADLEKTEAGRTLKKIGKVFQKIGKFIVTAVKNMIYGHFKKTAASIKTAVNVSKWCSLDESKLSQKLDGKREELSAKEELLTEQCNKFLNITNEDESTMMLTEKLKTINDQLKNDAMDPDKTPFERQAARDNLRTFKSATKEIVKLRDDVGELNKISKMNTAQRTSYCIDKNLDAAANVANSIWSVSTVAAMFCPALAPVAGLGGAIFITAKSVKCVNNLVVRTSINKAEKEKIQEKLLKIADKLDCHEILDECKSLLETSDGRLSDQTMELVRDKLEFMMNELGTEGTSKKDLDEICDLLIRDGVATEEMVNGIQGGISDALNIVTWAVTATAVGNAGSELLSGGGFEAAGEAIADHFVNMGADGTEAVTETLTEEIVNADGMIETVETTTSETIGNSIGDQINVDLSDMGDPEKYNLTFDSELASNNLFQSMIFKGESKEEKVFNKKSSIAKVFKKEAKNIRGVGNKVRKWLGKRLNNESLKARSERVKAAAAKKAGRTEKAGKPETNTKATTAGTPKEISNSQPGLQDVKLDEMAVKQRVRPTGG